MQPRVCLISQVPGDAVHHGEGRCGGGSMRRRVPVHPQSGSRRQGSFVISWLAPCYSAHSPSPCASHINLPALDDLPQACPEIPPATVILNSIKLTVKTNINTLKVKTVSF